MSRLRTMFKLGFIVLFVLSLFVNALFLSRNFLRSADEPRHSLILHDTLKPECAMTGTISAFIGTEGEVPSGWLACAGQAVPVDLHPELAAAFPSRWSGEDGLIRLPDLRGFFVLDFTAMDLKADTFLDRWIIEGMRRSPIGHLTLGVLPNGELSSDEEQSVKRLTFCVKS